jgi:hypothetical protein
MQTGVKVSEVPPSGAVSVPECASIRYVQMRKNLLRVGCL